MKYVEYISKEAVAFQFIVRAENRLNHRFFTYEIMALSMVELVKKLPAIICEEEFDLTNIVIEMQRADARNHMRPVK